MATPGSRSRTSSLSAGSGSLVDTLNLPDVGLHELEKELDGQKPSPSIRLGSTPNQATSIGRSRLSSGGSSSRQLSKPISVFTPCLLTKHQSLGNSLLYSPLPVNISPSIDHVSSPSAGEGIYSTMSFLTRQVPNVPAKTTIGFGANSSVSLCPSTSSIRSSPRSFGIQESSSASSSRHSTTSSPRGSPIRPTPPTSPNEEKKKVKKEKKEQRPSDGKVYAKKPQLTRAERRAVQEAQRAAKEEARVAKASGGKGEPVKSVPGKTGFREGAKPQADDDKRMKEKSKILEKQGIPERSTSRKQVALFKHLPQYQRSASLTAHIGIAGTGTIHPAIIRLGLKISQNKVEGSTTRCVEMLKAFMKVIEDYSTYLKHEISHSITPMMSEDEAKAMLLGRLADFEAERIAAAQRVIATDAYRQIKEGDVVMVHTGSTLILSILRNAHKHGTHFRAIVVDSRPRENGIAFLKKLIAIGISCTYVKISAISYIMREVTSVMLGANALLANGYVMGRVGNSLIAMLAKSHNIPVMVACETYKFCERVQTDAFVYNELGDPDDLVEIHSRTVTRKLDGWEDIPKLKLLNLVYDVIPPDLVDMVITEIGMIPCTSVPVVLRVKDLQVYD